MISSNMLVAEILDCLPQAATMLIDLHVECIGCSMNKFCSLEDLCRSYDLDLNHLVEMLLRIIGTNRS